MKFIDQTGCSVEFDNIPQRIISLVPSQSELLWDLGLKNNLVGITKFCIHPDEMYKSVERIGGTKQLNLDKIRNLNPDLIIGNKEENNKVDIEQLQKEFPVWISDVNTVPEANEMINEIGCMTGTLEKANEIINNINNEFKRFNTFALRGKTVVYLIWYEPLMAAAGDTFINALLNECGLINVFKNEKRYPQITPKNLQELQPDFIFLSSEPFPFNEKHCEKFSKLYPHSKVMVVDGEMFSWYGSRLQKAPKYFEQLVK